MEVRLTGYGATLRRVKARISACRKVHSGQTTSGRSSPTAEDIKHKAEEIALAKEKAKAASEISGQKMSLRERLDRVDRLTASSSSDKLGRSRSSLGMSATHSVS